MELAVNNQQARADLARLPVRKSLIVSIKMLEFKVLLCLLARLDLKVRLLLPEEALALQMETTTAVMD
jgi:hypothetical protein